MHNRTYAGAAETELWTIDDCMKATQLGRQTVKRIAQKAGCLYKPSSCYRIDKAAFYKYFKKEYLET